MVGVAFMAIAGACLNAAHPPFMLPPAACVRPSLSNPQIFSLSVSEFLSEFLSLRAPLLLSFFLSLSHTQLLSLRASLSQEFGTTETLWSNRTCRPIPCCSALPRSCALSLSLPACKSNSLMHAASYGALCPMAGLIADRTDRAGCAAVGIALCGISFLFIGAGGPLKILLPSLSESRANVFVASSALGGVAALAFTPLLPLMVSSVEFRSPKGGSASTGAGRVTPSESAGLAAITNGSHYTVADELRLPLLMRETSSAASGASGTPSEPALSSEAAMSRLSGRGRAGVAAVGCSANGNSADAGDGHRERRKQNELDGVVVERTGGRSMERAATAEGVHDLMSGLINAAYAAGGGLGPLISGVSAGWLGFAGAATVYAGVLVANGGAIAAGRLLGWWSPGGGSAGGSGS